MNPSLKIPQRSTENILLRKLSSFITCLFIYPQHQLVRSLNLDQLPITSYCAVFKILFLLQLICNVVSISAAQHSDPSHIDVYIFFNPRFFNLIFFLSIDGLFLHVTYNQENFLSIYYTTLFTLLTLKYLAFMF